jgi:cytochrome c oxidase assembly protein subunit 15
MPTLSEEFDSRWPHRLAWIVAVGVFPLIWMGGLVTTYGAGMAVPDWPTTFGHWFYPLQKWLWNITTDLFLEHGHRSLAQIVGLASLFLLAVVFQSDRRKTLRWLAIAILFGLLIQGTLGGLRVWWDDRVFARIHGCTAPVVFSLCTIMVTMTSQAWREEIFLSENGIQKDTSLDWWLWLTTILTAGIYLEIVLGTQVRHPQSDTLPEWFSIWLWSKVITAGVLVIEVIVLWIIALKKLTNVPILRRRLLLLSLLVFAQLLLAGSTWVVNYGWPQWFTENFVVLEHTVVKNGPLQVWLTTAHSAVGSLVLIASLNLTIWSRRLIRRGQA